ncbi:MAG TPA: hypothetical protein GXX70_01615 [Tepidimicrobium sp.]|nr:hypothetical protein [Tepidimicrobium sp.]
MHTIFQIVYFFIYNIIQIFKSPFYWVVVGIIAYQYKKIGKWENLVLGSYRRSLIYNIFTSMVMGLLGGILGSVIFVYLGTIIDLRDFYILLIFAILLSLINPRYMCFAYGGGIMSLISLKFGYPRINVPEIMTVVGVLHLIESILILLDGTRGRLPIFVDGNEGLVGGFSMNRFWPIPFVIFINKGRIHPATIMAILGYGDIALANYPEKKSKWTSGILFIFSTLVIALAQISITQHMFRYMVAIFAPLAHEAIVIIGKQMEERGEFIFKPSDMGLRVLDTLPHGIGRKMGLEPGDVILSVNGNRVYYEQHIRNILNDRSPSLRVKAFNREKGLVFRKHRGYIADMQELGVVLVPIVHEYAVQMEEPKGIATRLLDRFRRKTNGFRN